MTDSHSKQMDTDVCYSSHCKHSSLSARHDIWRHKALQKKDARQTATAKR
jgi:hypothetical protein